MRRFDGCMDSCKVAMDDGAIEEALRHLTDAEKIAIGNRDTTQQGNVLTRRGEVLMRQGEHTKALACLYKAFGLFNSIGYPEGMATVYNHIGSIHHYDKNYAKAREHYLLSMAIRERIGPPEKRATMYNNFGALLEDLGKPDSALYFHRKSLAIREQEFDSAWIAVSYTNIGACCASLGHLDSARHYYLRSLDLLPGSANGFLKGAVARRIGRSYLMDGAARKALQWCGDALRIGEKLRGGPLIQESCECLYEAYEMLGNAPKALAMLKRSVAIRDSLFGEERVKEITRMELNHSFSQRQLADSLLQAEQLLKADISYRERITKERDQRNIFMVTAIGILMVAGGLYSRLTYVRRSRSTIQREQERSEKLLLNILPKDIAEELKERGEARARDVDKVTILFTDFKDFSLHSASMNARDLVATLNEYYKAFDEIVARHGLEKIKTIGDAYMAAGGLNGACVTSAADTVFAALEIRDHVERVGVEREVDGSPTFSIRIGIHTGPVVAGIVGTHKFQYDIWGDTVNIANRMESSGMVGKVNISSTTYNEVKFAPGIKFAARGPIEVKGGVTVGMYFAETA